MYTHSHLQYDESKATVLLLESKCRGFILRLEVWAIRNASSSIITINGIGCVHIKNSYTGVDLSFLLLRRGFNIATNLRIRFKLLMVG